MAALSSLVDAFTGTSLDTTKWIAYGDMSVSDGHVNLGGTSDGADIHSQDAALNGLGSSLTVTLLSRALGSADPQSNIVVASPTDGTTVRITFNAGGDNNVRFLSEVGYVDSSLEAESTMFELDGSIHKVFRISETGGQVSLAWSTDGVSFTTARSIATPSWWSTGRIYLSVDGAADDGAAQFTNVNVAAASGGGGGGDPVVVVGSGSQEQPVWRDEFNGNAVKYANQDGTSGIWLTKGDEGNTTNYSTGSQDYAGKDWDLPPSQLTSKGIATVANSVLTLSPMRNDGSADAQFTWLSAYFVADDRQGYSFQYGYCEIRARWPNPCLGMFPALWFFRSRDFPAGKNNAEIDLLEIFGHPSGSPWSSGWHHVYGSDEGHLGDWNDDTTQWHRYALEKKPGEINFYIDGQKRASLTGAAASWFDSVHMVPRINYGMDPNWDFSIQSTPTNPAPGYRPKMEVDYIRYFAAIPSVLATGSGDPLGVQAKLSTLVDSFPGTTLNAQWASDGAAPTVFGNVLSIPATTGYNTVKSTTFFDPTSSAFYCRLVYSTPLAGISNTLTLQGPANSGGTDVTVRLDSSGIHFLNRIGFTDTGAVTIPVPGDPAIWVQVRDDGTNIYIETAPEPGTDWTVRRALARTDVPWWNATSGVQAVFTAHSDTGTATPMLVSNVNTNAGVVPTPSAVAPVDYGHFDNVNVLPGQVPSDGTDYAKYDNVNTGIAIPGPVRNLAVSVSNVDVTLTWDTPNEGGGAVDKYQITGAPIDPQNPPVANQSTNTHTVTFPGLVLGAGYRFAVTAHNDAGYGPPVSTGVITTGTVGPIPDPPPGVVVGPLPNTLPVFVLPSQYVPLTLSNEPDDGDTLANLAVQRLVELTGNRWRPYLSSPEVAALQVAAYIGADLRALVRNVGDVLYEGFGSQLMNFERGYAARAHITTTWTVVDTAGYTIPQGTQVTSNVAGNGSPLTFSLAYPLTVPSGQTQVASVVLLADYPGSAVNVVPAGPLEVQQGYPWLISVVATSGAEGGTDREDINAYRSRLVSSMRTMSQQCIAPADFSTVAQQVSGVQRTYSIPNYDPTTGATPERTIAVFCIDGAGLPIAPDVANKVQTLLDSRRELNFQVILGYPVYVPVDVQVVVVAMAGFDLLAVQQSVGIAIEHYLDPNLWEGGQYQPPLWTGRTVLRPYDIAAVISDVPGVDHIQSLSVAGGSPIPNTANYDLVGGSNVRVVLPAGLIPTTVVGGWGNQVSRVSVSVQPAGSV